MNNPYYLQADQDAYEAKIRQRIDQLAWSREEINAFRTQQLRKLLEHCITHSSWYRNRFAELDIDTITADDLSSIPPMTKQDMLKHWDDIVCVPNITYESATAFAQQKGEGEPLMHDHYHIWASGGSSGMRGLYVWSIEDFADFAAMVFRWRLRESDLFLQERDGRDLKRVYIVANHGIHITPTLYSTKLYPNDNITHVPADTPRKKMIDQLITIQPTHIEGYASIILMLAKAQLSGELKISPIRLASNSEPMTRDMRATINEAWPNAPLHNHWGSTDSGCHAISCNASPYPHLNEDMNIIEPVDLNGEPVRPGERCDKLYSTCLYNFSFPLIRYEMSDQITVRKDKCPCGAQQACIEDIEGRLEDSFEYPGGIVIWPGALFEALILEAASVCDYQIYQTEGGIKLLLITEGETDDAKLSKDLAQKMTKQGLKNPTVTIETVNELNRHPETDKLKRVVSL